ncbi:MAG TPA: fibronectin type III domain-containing protein [Methylomirabilota bacterium]|nr:fibronectin type III domain-containing protein [Methylomirabilota bacterium]
MYKPTQYCLWFFLVVLLVGRAPAFALTPRQYAVEVTAQVQVSPPQVRLQWPFDSDAALYSVHRKPRDTANWSHLANLPGSATGYVDNSVAAINAYEYQIVQYKNFDPYPNGDPSQWAIAYGYIYVGVTAPLVTDRGHALLVIDTAIASSITAELALFTADLAGDGWTVEQIGVSRDESVGSVRAKIRDARNRTTRTRAVVLIGHVPVPYSGDIYPDLHQSHQGAWPADAYYGDLDGNWTDNFVWRTDGEDPRNHNAPGDGKFDQSTLPSDVDLEVGRIDFYDLSIDGRSEVELLRQYFRKNHNYRYKQFSLPLRGLIRDKFGETDGDAPAASAWRAYVPMFGRNNVVEVAENDYFPRLSWDGFLWSFGAGGGSYEHADGVGYTPDFYRRDPKTVFAILHGSYFGDWDSPNNFLRGALAAPTYTLAAIWAGLPHWYLHHMALGETLGYSTRIAQNNWDTYKSQMNLSPRQVHISLIGDPTLRMHFIAPPRNVRGTVNGSVSLQWDASPEATLGYLIYRAPDVGQPFVKLNRFPVTGTSYTDANYPGGRQVYMVRAYTLTETTSGSFYNTSSGAFWNTENGPAPEPEPEPNIVTITAPDPSAAEEGQEGAVIQVTRSGDLKKSITVNLTWSGSAQLGVDLEPLGTTVLLSAGQASSSFGVRPVNDSIAEGAETLIATIAPGTGYTLGQPSSATVQIADRIIRPVIESVGFTEDKSMRLKIRGAINEKCLVEVTSDLKRWTEAGQVQLNAEGRAEFIERPSNATRFYRIEIAR